MFMLLLYFYKRDRLFDLERIAQAVFRQCVYFVGYHINVHELFLFKSYSVGLDYFGDLCFQSNKRLELSHPVIFSTLSK